ncbi:cupin domain-containing protein [Flavobacterium sp. N502540]|uniref:cupin domain-containing protein n=1 Tax=Flavobacterium sp. N502540 TaxID=2986838 RepID=UPI0022251FC7|nr:cupin domain-containing protein [Flavobacterium sp. N502540]
MEVKKLTFPKTGEYYLKYIFEKSENNVQASCGSVFLKKGEILPFKTLDSHEFALLLSGKLLVYTQNGAKVEMNAGDLIYIHKEEVRETETLEDSQVLFFLFV